MKGKLSFLLFFVLIGVGVLAAQTPESKAHLDDKLARLSSPFDPLRQGVWANPSLAFYRYQIDLHHIQVEGWSEKRGEAALLQAGNEDKAFKLSASSRLRLSPQRGLMGSISYEKGRQDGVKWNTTADFDLLFPYVIATRARSFINREAYCFTGTYLREWQRFNLAAHLDYRAEVTSRPRDPRPRNIVSDMTGKLSTAWLLGGYRLGAVLGYRNYYQNSRVTWMGDMEKDRYIYHFTGFGYEHYRGTTFTDQYANYVGSGLNASLDLLPVSGSGFSASFGWDRFHFTKELPISHDAPIDKQVATQYRGEVSWLKSHSRYLYGVQLSGKIGERVGTEHSFKKDNSIYYEVDEAFDGLKSKAYTASASLVWGQDFTSGLWRHYSLTPTVSYRSTKQEYEHYKGVLEWMSMDYSLRAKSLLRLSDEWWLRVDLAGGYAPNSGGTNGLGYPQRRLKDAFEDTERDFYFLVDSYSYGSVCMGAHYKLRDHVGLYLQLSHHQEWYQVHGSAHRTAISLGLLF